jgi:uncharacterized membrane protein (DUF4010 family)
MDFYELISRFALALGIGVLIGLERGWRMRAQQAGSRTAGVRTFAISAILGGAIVALSQAFGETAGPAGAIVFGFGFAAYSIVITLFCLEENRADKVFSATTAVAAMTTFALGAFALVGDVRLAAALAVSAAVILALRESIHGWVARITWPELRSGFVLLAMTFIALPIMPDRPIGPYGGINPREIWIIAIVLAAISFFGYAAVKYWGAARGVLLAGAAGGLVSSTAVTVSSARLAAAGEGSQRLLAAGVALATAVMFLRVCGIVAVLKPGLLMFIFPGLVAAALTALGFAIVAVLSETDREAGEIEFRNPFDFWMVVGFALLLAILIPGTRLVADAFGPTAVILSAAVVGFSDADGITVSLARAAPQTLSYSQGALALVAAVSTNTISKIAIAATFGHRSFATQIATMGFTSLLAGGVALWGTLAWSGW